MYAILRCDSLNIHNNSFPHLKSKETEKKYCFVQKKLLLLGSYENCNMRPILNSIPGRWLSMISVLDILQYCKIYKPKFVVSLWSIYMDIHRVTDLIEAIPKWLSNTETLLLITMAYYHVCLLMDLLTGLADQKLLYIMMCRNASDLYRMWHLVLLVDAANSDSGIAEGFIQNIQTIFEVMRNQGKSIWLSWKSGAKA